MIGAQGGTVRLTAAGGVIRGVSGTGLAVDLGAGGVHGGAVLEVAEVSGGTTGIDISTSAQGPVSLSVLGPVSGGTGAGLVINGTSDQQGGAVSIDASGAISGGALAGGVQVIGAGGPIALSLSGEVEASDGTGISILHSGAGGAIDLTAIGRIAGQGGHGVLVETAAPGGVPAAAPPSGLAVDVALADVVASQTGVGITHLGGAGGDMRLATSGGAIQAGSGAGGVQVTTGAASGAVELDLQNAISGASGVEVMHAGTGDANIGVAGSVVATAGTGVAVQTGTTSGGALHLDLAAVSGTDHGVAALHGGVGDLTLALAGNLVADSGVALDLARGQAGRIDLVLDDGRAIAGGGTLGLRTQNVSGGETALDLSGQLSGDVALAVLGGGAGSTSHVTLRDGGAEVRGGRRADLGCRGGQRDHRDLRRAHRRRGCAGGAGR